MGQGLVGQALGKCPHIYIYESILLHHYFMPQGGRHEHKWHALAIEFPWHKEQAGLSKHSAWHAIYPLGAGLILRAPIHEHYAQPGLGHDKICVQTTWPSTNEGHIGPEAQSLTLLKIAIM